MTGFARVRRPIAQGEVVLSLKAVNHRGLDLHFHMPGELDPLESDLRAVIKSGVARGHLQIHVSIVRTDGAEAAQLNQSLLSAYVAAFRKAAELYELPGEPDMNSALRLPGMLTMEDSGELSEDVKNAVLTP